MWQVERREESWTSAPPADSLAVVRVADVDHTAVALKQSPRGARFPIVAESKRATPLW